MSEVWKVPNTVLWTKDKGYVKGVKSVKHCTVIWIKDQKAMYVKIVKGVKYFTEQKIKGYVKGVKSGVCGFYATLYTE